jgi:hypothetical protein
MNKLIHFWAILALVAPLGATKVHAQSFGAPIDLIAPVQEDIIRDLEQNGNSKKPSAVQYRPSYPPKYIKALQRCDNEEISGYIAAGRVTEDVDFDHPLLLRRARECGAISSERLEELLYYQRKYYNVDRPDTTNNIDNLALDGANLVDPPRRVNSPKATAPREEIIGVGIRATQDPKTKKFLVVDTIKGSPASISGVLPKDIIVSA